MERNSYSFGYTRERSSPKLPYSQREEEATLVRSNAKEKPADQKIRSNGETSGTSVSTAKCSVCLDTVSTSNMKFLPCAHVFHEICINEWLNQSTLCPLCKWSTTVNANDSPQMGIVRLGETFENYEVEQNESAGSEVEDWNNDEYESEEPGDEYESEDSGYMSLLEEHGYETEESHNESEVEESRNESEVEECCNELGVEASFDESEDEESHNEFEVEESRDEPE